jgi:hypothetical protein
MAHKLMYPSVPVLSFAEQAEGFWNHAWPDGPIASHVRFGQSGWNRRRFATDWRK